LWTPNKTPIIYPGSIERTAFAEKDETKGFYEIDINAQKEISYQFKELYARPMLDVVLEKSFYSPSSLKEEITNQIKDFPLDSIIRIKMSHKANLQLLNVKFLDSIIPKTMNYQIAGIRKNDS
jgi:DNA repair exonuclease SbcCD nuclease subunit